MKIFNRAKKFLKKAFSDEREVMLVDYRLDGGVIECVDWASVKIKSLSGIYSDELFDKIGKYCRFNNDTFPYTCIYISDNSYQGKVNWIARNEYIKPFLENKGLLKTGLVKIVTTVNNLPDPYGNAFNRKRIKAYKLVAEKYNVDIGVIRDVFCDGIDWYREEIKKQGYEIKKTENI